MNKEELLEEFDKRQKALRDEFISKLEDDNKEFEIKLPNKYDTLYYFDAVDTEIYMTGFSLHEKDITRFLHGYYFKTKEEAEQHLKERKLLFKLHQYAKEKNDGWEPDWSDNSQYKFSPDYNRLTGSIWVTDSTVYNSFSKLPYFKSEEIAQECIDLFGDEIKEVLC